MKKFAVGLCALYLLHSIQLVAGGTESNDTSYQSKFYVGFSLGRTDFDGDVVEQIDGVPTLTDVNDNDTGFQLYGGINLNKNFSIQAGYTDFGKFSSSYKGIYQSPIYRNDIESAEISGFYLAAVGRIPLSDKVDLTGKLGFMRWSFEGDASRYSESIGTPDSSFSASVSVDEDGTDPLFGLGISVKLNKKINITADYTRYEAYDTDINMFAIGMQYRLK